MKERIKISEKIADGETNDYGAEKKDYQFLIDKIIDPTYKNYKEALNLKSLYNNEQIKKELAPPVIIVKENIPQVSTTSLVNTVAGETIKVSSSEVHSVELPAGFLQIECGATKEEILYYFMILSKEKNHLTNEFFMTEEAVLEFVNKNFSVFNSALSGKYFPINILPKQKGILIHFMYWFYVKYDQKELNNKIKYAKLLKYNFDEFKDDNLKTLMSNMRESKKPKKGAIPISKYFPR